MQIRLIEEYEGTDIQVMPVDEDEGRLPLTKMYGPVLLKENLTAVRKTSRSDELSGSKTLESVSDLFYVQDKLARRIILQGEAGYGKTVFCLKVLDCWSKAKLLSRASEGETGGGSVETRHISEQTEGAQGSESERISGKKLTTLAQHKRNALQSSLSTDDDDDDDDDDDAEEEEEEEDRELLTCLSLFDLVFYVPLRHAKHGTSSIVDLVIESISDCEQETEHKIKQMLRDGKIKSLVILDGLDEWRAPDTCRIQGFPDSDGLVNFSLLCTMRPWRMVSLRLGLKSKCDKVVQILGLKSSSIKTIIRKVLVNFYGLELSTPRYKEKFSYFYKKAKLPELESLMEIPLMLTSSCLVWNEEDETSKEKSIEHGDSSSDTSDRTESDEGDFDAEPADRSEEDEGESDAETADRSESDQGNPDAETAYRNEGDEGDPDAETADRSEEDEGDSDKETADRNECDEGDSDEETADRSEEDEGDSDEETADRNECDEGDSDSETTDRNKGDQGDFDSLTSDRNESAQGDSDSHLSDRNESDQGDSDSLSSDRNESDQGDSDSQSSERNQSDQEEPDSETADRNEGDQAKTYFMTAFYLKLEEITITRAENKHGTVKSFLDEKRKKHARSLNVPGTKKKKKKKKKKILLRFPPIIDFIEILKPVGRLAFKDLVSKKPHLVFPKNKLEREIGLPDWDPVELAQKAGILSQAKAPGLPFKQMVSLSFYHKSIQEFIAALYMSCGDEEALESFRKHCNSVDKVMELSNMIMFVFGLDPVVGCQLSKHVTGVINGDADIIKYREFRESFRDSEKVEELCKMQRKWFREMKHNLSFTHNTDQTPTLHATDVYLDRRSDRRDVRVASELVSMKDNSIVSVYLNYIEHPVRSIIRHLPGCKYLTSLYTNARPDTKDMELLAKLLPKLVHLQCVRCAYGYHGPCPRVQQLPALRILRLRCIKMTKYVTLPPQIQNLELCNVIYPRRILASLPGCLHLTSLDISLSIHERGCELEELVRVLPQLHQLQYIRYDGSLCFSERTIFVAIVSALQHLTQLKHIRLECTFPYDEGTLLVTPRMKQLQTVEMYKVNMSARRWTEFISSLLTVQHTVHVTLNDTNIDCDSLKTIHSSQRYAVKRNRMAWFDMHFLDDVDDG